MKDSPKLEPRTSNTIITSVGRGGGGNIFKTESTTPPHDSPRLIPVTSAGNGIPADQKKFSISRGGYGNMRDNQKNHKDDANHMGSVSSRISSPELMPTSSITSNSEVKMVPLDSVKSIGRGGFGNQIKNIKENRDAKKKDRSPIFGKIAKFFR